MKSRLIGFALCLLAVLFWGQRVWAADYDYLFDGNIDTYVTSDGNFSVTVEEEAGIGGLYLMFDLEYGPYTITDNATGAVISAGEQGFLHEYVALDTTSVTLNFGNGPVRLSEIQVLAPGQVPKNVQQWEPPADGEADILLLSTHGDDDQLFFAGLLPYYAGQRGATVQVVYLTDHRNLTNERTHEMLNGLWAVGCRTYPVFGSFDDFRIDDLQSTYEEYARLGVTEDDLVGFVTQQLRRFRPQAVVGHDILGEYGHGMHMVYTDALIKALEISGDENFFPESAERYGLWDVPKTYLHLYEANPIVLDYDQPLAAFGGMTAFEVTQKLGYPCHKSQQYTWFTDWINGKQGQITKASEIKNYSPCQFGLYRSTVGADVVKNDFLENLTTYAEQKSLEQERLEQERLEQERLEQERREQERLEQERLEQERLEQERLEQERLEQEQLEQTRQEATIAATVQSEAPKSGPPSRSRGPIVAIGTAIGLAIFVVLTRRGRSKK